MTLKTIKTKKLIKPKHNMFHNTITSKSQLVHFINEPYDKSLPTPACMDSSYSLSNYLDVIREERIIQREISQQGYIGLDI